MFGAVPAAAQTAVEPRGTAATTVDLGGITAGQGALRLGGLRAYASSDDDAGRNAEGGGARYALAEVDLADRAVLSASSTGDGTDPGATVDIGDVGTVTAGPLNRVETAVEVSSASFPAAEVVVLAGDPQRPVDRADPEPVTIG